MSNNLTPTIIGQNEIDTLARAGVIPKDTPTDILKVFAVTANQHKLSPFKKEIYLVKYGQTYNTIVGIDGLRAKAARTGQTAGKDDAKFDMQPDGTYKTAAQLSAAKQKPVSCTVTVYRAVSGLRCPFTKTVLFNEYCPAQPSNKWASMPFNMIEKVAEAHALRMAFADEVSGLNIEEESAAIQDITVTAAEVRPQIEATIETARMKCMELLEQCRYEEHHEQDIEYRIKNEESINELRNIARLLIEHIKEATNDPKKQFEQRMK